MLVAHACTYHSLLHLLVEDVDAGQKILVRLRPARAPDTFYDEEDILHTMLHEVHVLVSF